DDVRRLLRDASLDLAAERGNALARLVSAHCIQRAGEHECLSCERALAIRTFALHGRPVNAMCAQRGDDVAVVLLIEEMPHMGSDDGTDIRRLLNLFLGRLLQRLERAEVFGKRRSRCFSDIRSEEHTSELQSREK